MIIKKNKIKQWEEKKQQEEMALHQEQEPVTVVEDFIEGQDEAPEEEPIEDITPIEPVLPPEPEIDLFNIENIDFSQRQERRRGTRRRGYRRIDDRNLVSRAQEEAENIKKSAFEEGYRKGLEAAGSDIAHLRNNIAEFLGAPKEVFEYIAPDILEISVNIAKTIIKKELSTDPQVLLDIIIDVLRKSCKNEPKVSVRVHPQFVAFIKDALPNMIYEYGIETKINIISDQSLDIGNCILQTNNGIIDASIDTQIEIIKKALEGI